MGLSGSGGGFQEPLVGGYDYASQVRHTVARKFMREYVVRNGRHLGVSDPQQNKASPQSQHTKKKLSRRS